MEIVYNTEESCSVARKLIEEGPFKRAMVPSTSMDFRVMTPAQPLDIQRVVVVKMVRLSFSSAYLAWLTGELAMATTTLTARRMILRTMSILRAVAKPVRSGPCKPFPRINRSWKTLLVMPHSQKLVRKWKPLLLQKEAAALVIQGWDLPRIAEHLKIGIRQVQRYATNEHETTNERGPGLKPVLDCGEAARYLRRAKRPKRGPIYPREMIEACNRFLRKRGVE
jgi:hypothetical protein